MNAWSNYRSSWFWCVVFVLIGTAGAHADVTVVAAFNNSDNNKVLFAATADPSEQDRYVGMDIRSQHLDDHWKFDGTYEDITIVMFADDWQKFLSAWKKARATQDNGDFGDVFVVKTLLSLSRDRTTSGVMFTMARKDEDSAPMNMEEFDLRPQDYPAFETMIDKVNDYFRK
jgi:hypothetical protein